MAEKFSKSLSDWAINLDINFGEYDACFRTEAKSIVLVSRRELLIDGRPLKSDGMCEFDSVVQGADSVEMLEPLNPTDTEQLREAIAAAMRDFGIIMTGSQIRITRHPARLDYDLDYDFDLSGTRFLLEKD